MGSLTPDETSRIVGWIRDGWKGEIGIHTHDNMGRALSNSLRAQVEGVTWIVDHQWYWEEGRWHMFRRANY